MIVKRILLVFVVAVVVGLVIVLVMKLTGLGRSAALVGGVTAAVIGALSYGAMDTRGSG